MGVKTKHEADTTVELPTKELRLYARNPRKGNVGAIAASLKAHRQYRPLVANIGTHTDKPLEVLKGNHTLKAIRQLARQEPDNPAWQTVKVHLVDVDADQAAKIVLADNKTSEAGTYDNEALASLLSDVSHDLEGLGYTATDLDSLTKFSEDDAESDTYVDLGDLDDEPEPESGGRGAMVISYSIVFDDQDQRKVWMDFVNWLKRSDPDATGAERLCGYIEGLVEKDAEDE